MKNATKFWCCVLLVIFIIVCVNQIMFILNFLLFLISIVVCAYLIISFAVNVTNFIFGIEIEDKDEFGYIWFIKYSPFYFIIKVLIKFNSYLNKL